MNRTDRTILVLNTEVRRMTDAAERVRLVTEALSRTRPRPRQIANDPIDTGEEFFD